MNKIKYWNRIFKAYVLGRTSHLSFWHEEPKINSGFVKNKLVLIPKNVIHFEKIIEKILKKKIKHNCFKNFNKLYYNPQNLNTLKTVNKHYNEYCRNLC